MDLSVVDRLSPLSGEDRYVIKLRLLYEGYGYRHFHIDSFESYDLYRDNRDFLSHATAITFPDSRGRLMALKPDVTMSIVKRFDPEGPPAKWHYRESVFRREEGRDEVREIRQMGIEYLGGPGLYPEAEVLTAAMESLALTGAPYVLAINHMGLLDSWLRHGERTQRREILEALRLKRPHALWDPKLRDIVTTLVSLPADPLEALSVIAETLPELQDMQPLKDLRQLVELLTARGSAASIRLDTSVQQALSYYNGIIFQGFVKGVPRPVLHGGRYDRLLSRIDRPARAVGFALDLDLLADILAEDTHRHVTALLSHDRPPADVLAAADTLRNEGRVVRVCHSQAEAQHADTVMALGPDGRLQVLAQDGEGAPGETAEASVSGDTVVESVSGDTADAGADADPSATDDVPARDAARTSSHDAGKEAADA